MAKRSYLTDIETQKAFKWWKDKSALEVSEYLENCLLGKIKALPKADQLQIFGIGSIARGELCPQSDIDLLIIGDEADIKEFMTAAFESTLKIRARTFQKASEVFEGAEAFDMLSMMDIKPLFQVSKKEYQQVQEHILGTIIKKRRGILKVLKEEKKDRKDRFDSLVSYLEPNLKLGSGGLRDIQQSLYLFRLFPEFFQHNMRARKKLEKEKLKLLYWRQGLHFLGFNDTLVAQAQLDLQKQLNYKSISRMMTNIEKSFSESAFYASWSFAKIKGKYHKPLPKQVGLSLRALKRILTDDTSELTQESLRNKRLILRASKNISSDIRQILNSDMSEAMLMALFDSKMMGRIFSDLKKVEGLVQHDQYHLLTVDAHLKQAMRIVLRLKNKSNYLGNKVKPMVGQLNRQDWEIIFWTAFFHDLAKGRRGDHSSVGKKLCEKVLRSYGFNDKWIHEIAWLVENHLVFSTGAFRRNPQSPKTLHWLMSRGVKGKRALRLAIFTVIDIYATNPTAWNSWKEKLIVQLYEELTSTRAKKLERFLLGFSRGVLDQNLEFYSLLDQRLIAELPANVLRKDLKSLQKRKDLEPLIVPAGGQRFWIRFHNLKDEDGIFLRFVRALHASGLSVAEAFVQTYADYGVYDWFLVRGSRQKDSISKILKLSLQSDEMPIPPNVKFEKVEVIEQDDYTAVISFRGLDQKGALLTAANSVFGANLPIIWAKVVTWGRRIDDVFCVKAVPEALSNYKKQHIPKLLK